MHNLAKLKGRPLDESTLDLIIAALYREITKGRQYSERLARQYYESVLEREDLRSPTRKLADSGYDREVLKAGLTAYLKPHPDKTVTSATVGEALQMAQKHCEDAGRRQIIGAVQDDDRFSGWARVASGRTKTCPFCLMLISRGPVYKSAKSAGESNQWHAGCSCRPVFVRKGRWDGKDQFHKAEQFYVDSTRGVKHDKLNALRRAMNSGDADFALPRAS